MHNVRCTLTTEWLQSQINKVNYRCTHQLTSTCTHRDMSLHIPVLYTKFHFVRSTLPSCQASQSDICVSYYSIYCYHFLWSILVSVSTYSVHSHFEFTLKSLKTVVLHGAPMTGQILNLTGQTWVYTGTLTVQVEKLLRALHVWAIPWKMKP